MGHSGSTDTRDINDATNHLPPHQSSTREHQRKYDDQCLLIAQEGSAILELKHISHSPKLLTSHKQGIESVCW